MRSSACWWPRRIWACLESLSTVLGGYHPTQHRRHDHEDGVVKTANYGSETLKALQARGHIVEGLSLFSHGMPIIPAFQARHCAVMP